MVPIAGLLLVVASFGLVSAAQEQPAADEALSVDQAVQIAVANNRNLKIVSLSLDGSKEKLAAEKTRRLPSFSTYIFASQLLAPINFTVPAGQFGSYPGIGPIPATNTDITTPSQPTAYIVRQRVAAAADAVQNQHPHSRTGVVGRAGRSESSRRADNASSTTCDKRTTPSSRSRTRLRPSKPASSSTRNWTASLRSTSMNRLH